ncbi:S8 family serine peptidase [Bradyrhizobium huanghuaihaiense]|uniref:S8 family serine peptidase n=1 Tax=Bradyrhizobium huanghuaihaiense TaxID=990078 RepID=UPI00288B3AA7|nr:S8 family serine peptidase [Bradyrhizobium sp. CB3035]
MDNPKMTEVRYAIFETTTAQPASRRMRRAGLALDPLAASKASASVTTTTVRLLDAEEADRIRVAGRQTLRVPRMPVRLIPQVAPGSNAGEGQAWGIAAVGAGQLGLAGEGVCVAVLDTGIDPKHPAFDGLINERNYKDFTGTGLIDSVGHGTHCAGIIFGRTVNDERIGLATGITSVLIGKIADRNFTTTTDQLQQALNWAVNSGADVISLSVGLDFLGHASALRDAGLPQDAALVAALNDYRDYTRFFDRLIGQVVSAGAASRSALVVAAAGNDSHGDSQPPYRIGATLPAVAEKVLSVGAVSKGVGDLFDLAPFSNTGVDLCAPGVAIRSALPGGRYGAMTGTSQAAPHVAALAALWWQKVRNERASRPDPDYVRSLIVGAAKRERISGQHLFEEIGGGLAQVP